MQKMLLNEENSYLTKWIKNEIKRSGKASESIFRKQDKYLGAWDK